MKTLKNYLVITVLAVMQVFAVSSVFAQNSKGAIVLDKTFTPCDGWFDRQNNKPVCSSGEITLSAFVTGETQEVVKRIPCDIVLVLDASSSMNDKIDAPATYTKNTANYSYSSLSTTYYYKVGDDYYEVKNEIGYTKHTIAFKDINTSYYYLNNSTYWPIVISNDRARADGAGSNNYLQYKNNKWQLSGRSKGATISDNNTSIDVYTIEGCYLYYMDKNNVKYYLKNGGSTTNKSEAASSTAKNGTIWSGDLYTKSAGQITKLAALKSAVETFIDMVYENAYADGTTDKQYHDRISIVQFSGAYRNGDNSGTSITEGYTQGKTEVIKQLTDVLQTNSVTNLKTALNQITVTGNNRTAADLGMAKASQVLSQQGNSEHAQIVVMFTDGAPNDGSINDFVGNTADAAITTAKTLKGNKVTIYTIGVLGNNPSSSVLNYLQAVSSNYPNATAYNSLGTKDPDKDCYHLATDAEELESIFTDISSASEEGHASISLGTNTVIKDIMSDYFKLPDGVDATSGDIKVYTVNCVGAPDDKDGNTDYKWEMENGVEKRVVFNATIAVNDKTIDVTNYSLSDNYCGISTDGKKTAVGQKLIITIPIEYDNSIGTPKGMDLTSVPTNDENSGIYLNGELQVAFETPYADISNIVLPIELLSFNAECIDHAIQFAWSTATETNNEYFTIERSEDAIHYKEVARIQGAGTSTMQQDYSFMLDNNTGKTMYYRLRQTDIDGLTEVFEPVAVQCDVEESMDVTMYPVPAMNYVTIQSSMNMAEIQIHNVYGALVNRVEANADKVLVDVSNLANGIYTVKITMANGEQVSRKLIKR